MKKILLVSMGVLLLTAALAAQQINVIMMGGGDGVPIQWCPGGSNTIYWRALGSMQATVTITLRYANSAPTAEPALYIATGEANDGSYSWTIPGTVAPGDYFIRVRTDDMSVIGDGPVFKIAASPSIVVLTPKANEELCLWSKPLIQWKKWCAMQNTVTIALRAEGSAPGAEPALYIATGEANDGYFSWTIPDSVAPGNYFIRVRTDDATVVGDGAVFKIKKCTPSINVKTPNGGESWKLGQTKSITWEISGWTGEVNLILLRNGDYKGTIVQHVPAEQCFYNWTVGKLLNDKHAPAGGGYRVHVVRHYPGPITPLKPLFDESNGDFTLGWPTVTSHK